MKVTKLEDNMYSIKWNYWIWDYSKPLIKGLAQLKREGKTIVSIHMLSNCCIAITK